MLTSFKQKTSSRFFSYFCIILLLGGLFAPIANIMIPQKESNQIEQNNTTNESPILLEEHHEKEKILNIDQNLKTENDQKKTISVNFLINLKNFIEKITSISSSMKISGEEILNMIKNCIVEDIGENIESIYVLLNNGTLTPLTKITIMDLDIFSKDVIHIYSDSEKKMLSNMNRSNVISIGIILGKYVATSFCPGIAIVFNIAEIGIGIIDCYYGYEVIQIGRGHGDNYMILKGIRSITIGASIILDGGYSMYKTTTNPNAYHRPLDLNPLIIHENINNL